MGIRGFRRFSQVEADFATERGVSFKFRVVKAGREKARAGQVSPHRRRRRPEGWIPRDAEQLRQLTDRRYKAKASAFSRGFHASKISCCRFREMRLSDAIALLIT